MANPCTCPGRLQDLVNNAKPPVRPQTEGATMFEAFTDWKTADAGATLARITTNMSNATVFDLPRGNHVMRIHTLGHLLHATHFHANRPFKAGQYYQVRDGNNS